MTQHNTLRARLPASWRTQVLLGAGFALIVLAVIPPGNVSSDGASMLAVMRSLATHGSVSVPCAAGIAGRGGRCFSTYYPLNSFLGVPFFAVGEALGHAANVSTTFVGNAMAQMLPALSAAVTATLTVTLTRRFGATPMQSVLAGLTIVFGTEMAVLERTFFAEALLTALISLQVWCFYGPTLSRFAIPIILALTILAKPQAFLVGPLLALEVARRARSWKPIVLAAVGTASGAVIYGAYDYLRFSSVTDLGGPTRTLHSSALTPIHLVKALGLLTISPGRGFFVFSPICVLGLVVCVQRRREPLARAALIILSALLLVYVGNPGSGFNWASRYLAPALPLFVAAAWSTRTRILACALSLMGVLIQFPTFVGFYQRYYLENASHGILPVQRYWSVLHGPLLGVWGVVAREATDARTVNLRELVMSNTGGAGVADQRFFHVVSEWWWMLPAAHIPRLLGVAVSIAAAVAGFSALIAWARRQRGEAATPGRAVA